ncbi:MAG: thiamine-phosphate kinase [Bacteroidetes bacterium]|nr:thiamine-phosphate kinase [Bacteroidota bacterium]
MFENSGRTEISHLGEFGLIDHISKSIKIHQSNTIKGVGDDAAVIDAGDKFQLISTDMLVEGTHFDLTYTPLMHLGYKAIVTNISDIAAMNGKATHVLTSIAISNRFSLEAVEELYKGMLAACNAYGVDLVGGDTTSSQKGLILSVTCYGEVSKDKICYRNGCKPGDLVLVSGDLGAAYLGLHILEREKRIFLEKPDFKPDLEGNDYIIQRQLKPEARVDIVKLLNEIGVQPTSMIDISDGLSSELHHLAKQSHVGFTIYEDKLPIDPIAYQRAIDLGIDPSTAMLNGGEDYELLFTVPMADYEKIKKEMEVSIVGHAVEHGEGLHLISKANNKHKLTAQGWNHL